MKTETDHPHFGLRTLSLVCLTILASMAVGSIKGSASPVRWSCNCDPGSTALDANCSCSYSYELKKLGTKEFRAYCDHDVEGRTVDPYIENVHRDKNVTCTATFHSFTGPNKAGYKSKSCTNWNAAHKRSVSMSVKCVNEM